MAPRQSPSKALAHFPPALQSLIANRHQDSLHLLLETSGARSTWLTHRYASVALEHSAANVVLLTWSYGPQFWKQELRKSSSIDVDKSVQAGRLIIIDGDDAVSHAMAKSTQDRSAAWLNTLRGAIPASPTPESNTLLILDSPDLLLGTAALAADALLAFIMDLRTLVKDTVILTSSNIFATPPEIALASPLQTHQQHFLMSLIHQADYVLAARVLDTGQASDVSGVLRVTNGGHCSGEHESQAIDTEFLYHIDASRTARVWQRGAGR